MKEEKIRKFTKNMSNGLKVQGIKNMKEEEKLRKNIRSSRIGKNSTGKKNPKNTHTIDTNRNTQGSNMKEKIMTIQILITKAQMMEELFRNLKNILLF